MSKATNDFKWWREGLSHKDWLYDGHNIKSKEQIKRFNNLDWSRAWIDMGPSPFGNPGPYWHVPLGGEYEDEKTVHRLYPKLLATKWLWVIRQACEESYRRGLKEAGANIPTPENDNA